MSQDPVAIDSVGLDILRSETHADVRGNADNGMRDIEGNLWCRMEWAHPKGDVVRCYSPQGQLLGEIHLLT
jgi:sugar lactone lactonase YvrE